MTSRDRDSIAALREPRWTSGNALCLLENGEEYFPRVFEAIRTARREVFVETFVWFEDWIGHALRDVLVEVAQRGVSVDVTVDGFGTPHLSEAFLAPLRRARVRVFWFDRRPRLLGFRTNPLCRLHRKLVLVDCEVAFVGGINFSDEHMDGMEPEPKHDYAVEVRGPIVAQIADFCHSGREELALPARRYWKCQERPMRSDPGGADIWFATCGGGGSAGRGKEIEGAYVEAFQNAKHQITLANEYFFPVHAITRELERAAARGVSVRVILPGQPSGPAPSRWAHAGARALYRDLVVHGVRVFECRVRSLHAKVCVVDDQWATIGSSNLDPTSLALNLEANLVVRDGPFARGLRSRLDALVESCCGEVHDGRLPPPGVRQRLQTVLAASVRGSVPIVGDLLRRMGSKRMSALDDPGSRPT